MPRLFTSVTKASAAPVGRIVPASQRWTVRLCAHSKRANPAWLKPLSWRTAGFRPPPSVDKGFRRFDQSPSWSFPGKEHSSVHVLFTKKGASDNINAQHQQGNQYGTGPGKTVPVFVGACGILEDDHRKVGDGRIHVHGHELIVQCGEQQGGRLARNTGNRQKKA